MPIVVYKTGELLKRIVIYRSISVALVMFTIDAEYELGRRRIPNEEVAEAAMQNAYVMIPAGFKEEVKPLILKENAVKMLGLK